MALLTPTWLVTAIYRLTPASLKAHGIQVVLCDLDNTLIAWDNPDGTPELRDWLTAMHKAGLTVMVVSNNNHTRVARALKALDLPFTARALKPLPVGIHRAMRELGVQPGACVMVGDQLLTDILASHLAGVRSILVRPLAPTDAWNTRINRFIERFFLRAMSRDHKLNYQEALDDQH